MQDNESFWAAVAQARSPEVWIALAAGALYVYRKSENPKRGARVIEAGISGMLGYSLGPAAAAWSNVNEAIAVVLVTSLGYLALDVLTSLVADRALIKEAILKRIGGGNNGRSS